MTPHLDIPIRDAFMTVHLRILCDNALREQRQRLGSLKCRPWSHGLAYGLTHVTAMRSVGCQAENLAIHRIDGHDTACLPFQQPFPNCCNKGRMVNGPSVGKFCPVADRQTVIQSVESSFLKYICYSEVSLYFLFSPCKSTTFSEIMQRFIVFICLIGTFKLPLQSHMITFTR